MTRRIYLDLDGVMADFDGSFPAVFGLDHRSMADDDLWLHINGHPSFLRDLPPMTGAVAILQRAAGHIEARAAQRDQAQGERSMARTVGAFNALTGHQLSERDGWLFMVTLKMARACSTPTGLPDDSEDMCGCGALAGEGVAAVTGQLQAVHESAQWRDRTVTKGSNAHHEGKNRAAQIVLVAALLSKIVFLLKKSQVRQVSHCICKGAAERAYGKGFHAVQERAYRHNQGEVFQVSDHDDCGTRIDQAGELERLGRQSCERTKYVTVHGGIGHA